MMRENGFEEVGEGGKLGSNPTTPRRKAIREGILARKKAAAEEKARQFKIKQNR